MRWYSSVGGLAVAIACLVFAAPIRAEKPTRVEIGKMGKAATAYVEVPNRGSGTAFCIHPSGLFITNEHVIRTAEKSEITLVLDPALKSQRILHAKVVRVDKERDLALLRVEGAGQLPSLALGSVDGVAELMDVVAFGFPLGRALSPDKKEYPAISVNAGRVTSLRLKGGELQHIQIDVALTFGNSGGPVLDDNGKIVGVVVSGVRLAQGINQAIPVSHLDRFLKAPDIQFTPPELTKATLNKPLEFKAQVISVIPTTKPIDLELILKTGAAPESRHKMEFKDGFHRVSTVLARPDQAGPLELSAQFETGTVSGLVADREIQVGMQKVKLSACSRIQLQPKPMVVLRDGKTLEGMPVGLFKVAFQIGGQSVAVDLSGAKTLQVQAPQALTGVDCTIIARQDDKEIGRFETRVPVRGITFAEPADPAKVEIRPPASVTGTVTKTLPDTAADIRVGGSGRFLVLHLPKLKKLAVFDVNEAKIVRYIPLTEDKIVFAAGLDKVVIGLTAKGIVERWNLLSGEKELTRPVPNAADVTSLLMGSASSGPVVINGQFFDLETLKPLPIMTPKGIPAPWSPVSADGTVFGAWKANQSPAESTAFVLVGDELVRHDEGGMGHIVPGPDGRVLYTAKGICTSQFKGIRGAPPTTTYCLPAIEGNFFLSLGTAEGNKGGSIGVYLLGNDQPLVKDAGVAHGIRFDGWDRDLFGPWKRVFFIPRAELIVVFPPSNDRLELHHFSVDAALEKSGLDYLLVASQPPRTARAGTTFDYPIAIKSKHGKVTFKLDAGPKGMDVSPAGVVRWNVPADIAEGDEEVILSIKDGAGQEIFHTFKLRVVK